MVTDSQYIFYVAIRVFYEVLLMQRLLYMDAPDVYHWLHATSVAHELALPKAIKMTQVWILAMHAFGTFNPFVAYIMLFQT